MKLLKILSIIGLLSTLGSAHAGCSAGDCKVKVSTGLLTSAVYTKCLSDSEKLKKNPKCAVSYFNTNCDQKTAAGDCLKLRDMAYPTYLADEKEKVLNTQLSKDDCLKKAKEKVKEFNLGSTYPVGTVCINYETCVKTKAPKVCYLEIIDTVGTQKTKTSTTTELTEAQYDQCLTAFRAVGGTQDKTLCKGYFECLKSNGSSNESANYCAKLAFK